MKHLDTHTQDSQTITAIIASVLVHGLVVVGIFIAHTHQKPLPEVVQMEASLVSGNDFADTQAQIAKAYTANQTKHPPTTPATSITNKRLNQLNAYYDDLAAKEQAYQEQMAAYANALDKEILSDIQMHKKALDEAEAERQQALDELKKRTRSNDEIAHENSTQLEQAKQERNQILDAIQKANRIESKNLADGQATPTTPNIGRGGIIGGGNDEGNNTQNHNRSEVISALQRHIRTYWQSTGKNQTLKVSLKVDTNGNVTNISISGGDEFLRGQLEYAIHRASPLTPVIGTEYQHLNFNFNIN